MPHTVLHVFSTFSVGGPQIRYAQLANGFGQSFRHRIIAMDKNYGCLDRLRPELDVQVVEIPFVKGRTFYNSRQFRRALKDLSPDLLVTYNWGTIEWAMANWPRIVRHVHIEDGFGPEEATGQIARRVWARWLLLRRSTVVMPSQTLFRLATNVWNLNPSRVRYIPNGINCSLFTSPSDAITPPPWVGPRPIIGTVAALRREKNLGRLIRAVRLVLEETPCRLVIIGDGPERRALETIASDLGIADHVYFGGYVPNPEAYYRFFDIVALSSDTEQMPYSVIEGMAAGLPVVATAVGDIPQMVSRENLPFLTPCTDESLAAALRTVLSDPELRATVGTANRRKALNDYDERLMFAAYDTLFRGDKEHAPG
jgi:glycosyltransferase involved in cell wall biosynthesis